MESTDEAFAAEDVRPADWADPEATNPGAEPTAPETVPAVEAPAPEESASAPSHPEAEVAQVPVPRYTQDGVLLNPEDFNVTPDGLLIPKQG